MNRSGRWVRVVFVVTVLGYLSACDPSDPTTSGENPANPVITLQGADPVSLEVGATFTDPGATVTDDVDTGLTATVAGKVDTAVLGSYILTYDATDSDGNAARTVIRTINVVDTTTPVIKLSGPDPLIINVGASFVEPGYTVTDNVDTGLTATVTGNVLTGVPGTYVLTYNATDTSGNSATSVTRTVQVVDTVSPVISLLGVNPLIIEGGSTFSDPGATVTDNIDTGLTASVTGTVNTAVLGTYTLVYNAVDSSGNAATPVSRTVNVGDTTAPNIFLTGSDPMTVEGGSTFADPGATVTDNVEVGLTASVSGTVDTTIVGTYILIYTASDSSANTAAPVTRTVNVVDTTAPVITLSGANPMSVEGGSTFIDPGSSISDNIDTGLAATVTGSVDTTTVGSYVLSYNVSDSAGNAATPVTRNVEVVDTSAPIISLIGSDPMTLEGGSIFVDPGVTIIDNIDAALIEIVTGTVDTTAVGSYLLTYDVSDTAGNVATPVTRTVEVVDTTAPIITLIGADYLIISPGSTFTDPGTLVTDNIDMGLTTTTTGSVDVMVEGTYILTYDVSDVAGNPATPVTRTVKVGLVPPAPSLTLGLKQLQFTWPTVTGADHYRILVNPDGMSGFTVEPTASNIATTSHVLEIPVHLLNWQSAQYIVDACNLAETYCASSMAISLTSIDSISAIGYVKASNTGGNDRFGFHVSISGDGMTMAISAKDEDSAATGVNNTSPGQSDNSISNSGAVYVFIKSGTTWVQQAYIKASNPGADDLLGAKPIALSDDGNTLAVSAYYEDSAAMGINNLSPGQADNTASASGAVYVFTRSGALWTQEAYVKASNTEGSDLFGSGLALSGDGATLAVGAGLEDSAAVGIGGNQLDNTAVNAGAVYVFSKSGGAWTQQAYVKASNAEGSDYFGVLTALSDDGNTMAVSAHGEGSSATGIGGNEADNGALQSGAVYVFTRSGSTWSQQSYVKTSNPDAGDFFGSSVALSDDGNTMAVGANNEASAATGVGGNQLDNSAATAGAAYVFVRSGSTWAQQAYVKASNTDGGDYFGLTLDLDASGSTMAVGAKWEASNAKGIGGDETYNSLFYAGAVYIFERTVTSWVQKSYVKAPNTGQDSFGNNVAISDDGQTVVVGATEEDSDATGINGNQGDNYVTTNASGAAYLY